MLIPVSYFWIYVNNLYIDQKRDSELLIGVYISTSIVDLDGLIGVYTSTSIVDLDGLIGVYIDKYC
jgi:hypothetical protein